MYEQEEGEANGHALCGASWWVALQAAVPASHDVGTGLADLPNTVVRNRPPLPGSTNRPVWMDIQLDDPNNLANHHIRLKPMVLKSLLGAGYQCFGDLHRVSDLPLRNLYYVGIRTARQIRAITQHFESGAEASAETFVLPSDLGSTNH